MGCDWDWDWDWDWIEGRYEPFETSKMASMPSSPTMNVTMVLLFVDPVSMHAMRSRQKTKVARKEVRLLNQPEVKSCPLWKRQSQRLVGIVGRFIGGHSLLVSHFGHGDIVLFE